MKDCFGGPMGHSQLWTAPSSHIPCPPLLCGCDLSVSASFPIGWNLPKSGQSGSCPLLSSPRRRCSGLAVRLNFLAAYPGCKRISLLGREVRSVESLVGGGYRPWDVSQLVGSFSALDIVQQGPGWWQPSRSEVPPFITQVSMVSRPHSPSLGWHGAWLPGLSSPAHTSQHALRK